VLFLYGFAQKERIYHPEVQATGQEVKKIAVLQSFRNPLKVSRRAAVNKTRISASQSCTS